MNKEILAAFNLAGFETTQLSGGLINQTFLATNESRKVIIQRLSPIFQVSVLDDINVVTKHLTAKGIAIPQLLPRENGEYFFQDEEGYIWRALSYLPGCHFDAPEETTQCYSAGELLGRIHSSLNDLDYDFKFVRPHVHDSKWHFSALKEVINTDIDDWPQLQNLREQSEILLEKESQLLDFSSYPSGIVHGDPKIANFLFQDRIATSMVDLDTFAKRSIMTELGDAVRSFAAKADTEGNIHFHEPWCKAFCSGYDGYANKWCGKNSPAQNIVISEVEQAAYTITLELAARFAKEAFVPKYFAWDPIKYATAHDHNLARMQNLLNFAATFPSYCQK